METTFIFLAIFTLLFLFHSVRVSLARQEKGIGFGTGNDEELTRRVRIQGNFAEYIPLAVLLLFALENYTTQFWVWVFGLAVLLGRVLHAYGLWSRQTPRWARPAGMALTYVPLLCGAISLLWILLL